MRNDNDDDFRFEESSGNVFADVGLENADELLAKSALANAIMTRIRDNGWTQAVAAERLALRQPEVSNISRGRLAAFSQERLQTLLRRIGVDVEIALMQREAGGIGTLRVREYA